MRRLLIGAAIAIIAALGGLRFVQFQLESPGPLTAEAVVWIPRGVGLAETAEILVREGAIASSSLFKFGAWIAGSSRQLRAGEYELAPGASIAGVLAKLQSGEVLQRRLTVVEGVLSTEVQRLLTENPFLSGPPPPTPAEGAVAPETYFFVRGEPRGAVLGRMLAAQEKMLSEFWNRRDPALPYETPTAALTMASIIERETGRESERARVAAVFVNRLRRGMRLQSDPTVAYGLAPGQPLERELTRKDLASDTVYNTYRINGLPPAPIANPGRAAIEAAFHPAPTDDLYFVADGTGGHAFAKTLAEHNRNVARWRKLRQSAEGG